MKTFYAVTYKTPGADYACEKYFDNLSEAQEFAARDYSDSNIKVIKCRKQSRIEYYKLLVELNITKGV